MFGPLELLSEFNHCLCCVCVSERERERESMCACVTIISKFSPKIYLLQNVICNNYGILFLVIFCKLDHLITVPCS